MKTRYKFWALALFTLCILAVSIVVWDRHNRQWYETPTPSEVFKIPPAVTNNVIVAVGSFDFAEPDNLYPEFPDELASYLDAITNAKVTFVDRKPDGKSAPTSPDTWVLNGSYAAAPNQKWRVNLNLERVKGGVTNLACEGANGPDLYKQIQVTVEKAVTDPNLRLMPLNGKRQEFTLHLERGHSLAELADLTVFGTGDAYRASFHTPSDRAHSRFRFNQALRSFQSALALQPDSSRPKLFIAECYLSSFIFKIAKAREILTDIIENGPADQLKDRARFDLARSYELTGDLSKALALHTEAARTITNRMMAAIVALRIEALRNTLNLPNADKSETEKQTTIRELDDFITRVAKKQGNYFNSQLPFDSVRDEAERASRNLAFIETLKPKYTNVIPYILRSYVQREAKQAPVRSSFKAMMSEISANWSNVFAPKIFFDIAWDHMALSLFETDESLAMDAVLLKERAASAGLCDSLSDQMLIAKGFYLMNHQKLAEALDAFDKVGVRMVHMQQHSGPWGCSGCPVSALAMAERCAKLLGQPIKAPGLHTELQHPIFTAPRDRPMIATDGDRIWVGDSQKLQQLSATGEIVSSRNLRVRRGVSCLAVASGKLYVGTLSEGLIEIDLAGSNKRSFGVEDGLLSDHIADLKVIGDRLWIGYGDRTETSPFMSDADFRHEFGRRSRGGIGYLELSSGTLTNFVRPPEIPPDNPSIWNNKNNYGDWAPTLPVLSIQDGRDSGIYLAVYLRGLQRFEPASGKWNAVRFEPYCPISSAQISENFTCLGVHLREWDNGPENHSISIRARDSADFKVFSTREGLPNQDVGALLLDGNVLWAGGYGYVARIDLPQMKVTRVFTVPACEVNRILKVGSSLWIATNDSVYQTPI